jgi:hypothetical protein
VLGLLQQLDHQAFFAINGLAGHVRGVDRIIVFIRDSDLVKGVPVMMIWWGLWFHQGPRTIKTGNAFWHCWLYQS